MASTDKAYEVLATAKYYCTLKLVKYKRQDTFGGTQLDYANGTTIKLPLPNELRDDTAVAYNNIDLQLSGDLLNGNVGTGMAAEGLRQAGQLITRGAGAAKSFLSRRAGGGDAEGGGGVLGSLGGVLGDTIAEAFPADQIGSAIQQMIGVAPNPNPSVAFQGPQLRENNLSWTFLPTNMADSQNIRAIINILKQKALPQNSVADSAAVLGYPHLCQVNFYPWDSGGGGRYGWSPHSIIKMKPAFMSSVNVNYTSGSAPAFFNGGRNEPVAIQLSINFKEVEYFLSHDYGGQNGGGTALEDFAEDIMAMVTGIGEAGAEAANNSPDTTQTDTTQTDQTAGASDS
jgi:hypothetical protein